MVGQPRHARDRERSIPLTAFAPLASVPNVRFFSLQVGSARAQLSRAPFAITDLSAHLTDYAHTAAAIACLDLLIAVDTSVIHLAGALGRQVWALITYAPDWRWQLDRADTPWYPTMRLFRQPTPANWAGAIAQVGEALSTMALSALGLHSDSFSIKAAWPIEQDG